MTVNIPTIWPPWLDVGCGELCPGIRLDLWTGTPTNGRDRRTGIPGRGTNAPSDPVFGPPICGSNFLALVRGTKHKGDMLKRLGYIRAIACLFVFNAALVTGLASDNPFVGGWELTIPGGAAGWLGVEEVDGRLQARLDRSFDAEDAKMSALHARWVHEALSSGNSTPLKPGELDQAFARGIARAKNRKTAKTA